MARRDQIDRRVDEWIEQQDTESAIHEPQNMLSEMYCTGFTRLPEGLGFQIVPDRVQVLYSPDIFRAKEGRTVTTETKEEESLLASGTTARTAFH